MFLTSGDNSILINKTQDCYYDIRVNPVLFSGGSPGTGPLVLSDSQTIALSGTGFIVPLQANLKVSSSAGNTLSILSDGLYGSPATPYTDAQAKASISNAAPITYNSTTGVIGITIASTSQTGALSAADWNTFNNKVGDGENVGTGSNVFKVRSGANLQFRKLQGGTGINVAEDGDSVVISATASEDDYTDLDARASISNTLPITYNNLTGVIGIQTASGSQPGALSSTDWNTFNSKVGPSRTINTTFPLQGGGNLSADRTFSIAQASNLQGGYLSSTDWTTFNNKLDPFSWNNVTANSSKITLGGTPTGAVKNAFSIDVNEGALNIANMLGTLPIARGGTGQITANAALNALLPSQTGNATKALVTDGANTAWVTISGGGGGENPLIFTSPLTRVGDTVGIQNATTAQNGALTSSDWNTFNAKIGDGVNLGVSGARVFAVKSGANLQFRRLIQGTNVTIVENANDITISASGIGGGGSNAINATVSELATMGSPDLTKPYYITDKGREGLFYYDPTDTTTPAYGNGITIVNGTKRWKRSYVGALQLSWFDTATPFVNAKPDYFLDDGVMTGTNNTPALNNMKNAASANEPMEIGYGNWLFSTVPDEWTNSKTLNLTIKGSTYHPGIDFIRMTPTGGGISKHHRFNHEGRSTAIEGLVSPTLSRYTSNTNPDYDSFTGNFVTITDTSKKLVKLNFVTGFKNAIEIVGNADGSQENKIEFTWLYNNACGIRMTSADGTSYVDKNYCKGGRISGGYGVIMDGYQAYVNPSNSSPEPYNGAFRSNEFHNILFEQLENGIELKGDCTETQFIHCTIEGGTATGIWGNVIFLRTNTSDTPIANAGNYCRNTSFIGCAVLDDAYFIEGGRNTQIVNTPIWTNGGNTYAGDNAYTDNSGKLYVTSHINTTTAQSVLPTSVDHIVLVGTPKPKSQYGSFRLNNVQKTLSYDGVYQAVSGDTTLNPPTGYIRVNAGSPALSLTIENNQIFDGQTFWLEQLSSNTVQIRRQSDSVVVMPTSQITSTGLYLIKSAGGSGTFTATKMGAAGGGTGDVISDIATSVTGQLALYNGTTGKHITNNTGLNGFLKATAGVVSGQSGINISDINATGGTSTSFLRKDGTWATPAGGGGGGSYTFSTGLSEVSGVVTNNLVTGIAGNQTVTGSLSSGGDLILRSTAHATKGQIVAQDTIELRANSTAANTAPLKFFTGSLMTLTEIGAMEYNGTDLYFTNAIDGRQKICTATNNVVLTNKTWNGVAISPSFGGTGLTSYVVGDIIYASGTTTLAKRAAVATGNVLISQGVGTAPIWGKVGLTTHVSGTLPIANGGTNATTANAAINNLLPPQSVADTVLVSDGTNTSWQTNLGGFKRIYAQSTSIAPVTVGTILIPDNTAGEIEYILVGYNSSAGSTWKRHVLQSYVKKSGVLTLKGTETALATYTGDFTPGGATGANVTSNVMTLRAASVVSETVTWTGYYTVRYTYFTT